MAFWDTEESIITVDKNKSEKIEFKYCELKGKQYIGESFHKKNSDGEMKAVGGTSFPMDKWPEIRDVIDAAYNSHKRETTVEDK